MKMNFSKKIPYLRYVNQISKRLFFKEFSQLTNKDNSIQDGQHNLVITEKSGNIFMIGINRPEKRNCINSETAKELMNAFKKFEADETVNVAVLYGKGGNFCSGYDLQEIASSDVTPEVTASTDISFMGPTRMLTSKPVIAGINGYAVAGGMELALLCDLRVMEETAIMGFFCRRFGVPLVDGGTVRLSKMIGLSRALDLILTGRPIEAKEAFEIGLVNRQVACGTAIGQAVQLARQIARLPQECLLADRRSTYYATYEATSIQDALKFEYENAKNVFPKETLDGAKKFVLGLGKHGEPL